MADQKVWFIAGTSRGMGPDFAKGALSAGNAVVATGRNTETMAKAIGQEENLLVVKLDVTSLADAIAEQKIPDLQQQVNADRDLSTSMALEERSKSWQAKLG